MRVTLTYSTTDRPGEERVYHLSPERAEIVAARIRAEGGTASVGPLKLGAELRAMLTSVGVNPDSIR